jgi:ABC-type nickel/cobalt efflux system permease component RcnA
VRLNPRLIAGLGLGALVAAGLALWTSGAFQALAWWAATQQRELQATLGGHVQAMRAGQSAAFWSLIGLCAAYGFLHAVGPGHGKVLVTGAAIGTRVSALRMSLIALAGSLGQALVAIAAVYGAFLVFQTTARGAAEGGEAWIDPIGNAVIALIGAWLVARGIAALRSPEPAACGCGHGHHHHHPDPEAVARAEGLGPTLALVAGIALRPCTGALFVLVIAWRMDLAGAGALAVLAMGMGTAAFTILVALLAVGSRDAAFLTAGDGRAARVLAPTLQIGAGTLILAVGTILLCATLVA